MPLASSALAVAARINGTRNTHLGVCETTSLLNKCGAGSFPEREAAQRRTRLEASDLRAWRCVIPDATWTTGPNA